MPRRKTKPVPFQTQHGPLSLSNARKLVQIAAVILRDHSPLDLGEILELFIRCWNHTESVEESYAREAAQREQ